MVPSVHRAAQHRDCFPAETDRFGRLAGLAGLGDREPAPLAPDATTRVTNASRPARAGRRARACAARRGPVTIWTVAARRRSQTNWHTASSAAVSSGAACASSSRTSRSSIARSDALAWTCPRPLRQPVRRLPRSPDGAGPASGGAPAPLRRRPSHRAARACNRRGPAARHEQAPRAKSRERKVPGRRTPQRRAHSRA